MFDVSIILPSRNRYPLNLLTLYALEKQTFDLSKMEVILIDDGSTDHTTQLKNYHPPYSFKYVRNENNLAVSRARNIGLNLAQGKIIIFLDAEMIVSLDYVSRHYQHHLNNQQNSVVLGINKNKVFTFLFPRFNNMQIYAITRFFEDRPVFKKRLMDRLATKNMSKTELQDFIRKLKKPVQLIDQHEVMDLSLLNSFSKKMNYSMERYLGKCPNDSYLAWMGCMGSNHSFPKSLINQIGGYDEDFRLWGMEDTEFSYRLYKAGAKFIIDPGIARYHQEHPSTGYKIEKNIINTILFEKKHPEIDACIRSLLIINVNNYNFFHRVLKEYNLLCCKFSGQFKEFSSSLILMLQQIPKLKLKKQKTLNLLSSSGLGEDPVRKKRIFLDRKYIEALGEYKNLVRLFDILISL